MTVLADTSTYATIAEAEAAITGAGYVRDQQRHVWVQPDTGKTCKVVRTLTADNDGLSRLRFFVQTA